MKVFYTLQEKLRSFFTVPIHAAPLGVFRISIAAFTLLQAFLWFPDWLAFFGPDAWVQWEISKALVPDLSIHISQVHRVFSFFGLNEVQSVHLFFWIYVCSAAGLLFGIFTRFCAVLTWFCHYIILSSISIFQYGVDIFLHIALFYLMIMPVHRAYSLDKRIRQINTGPSWSNTLSIRVLQIHLCLIYLSSGYEKLLSPNWWSGNVVWRALVQPDFRQFDVTWMADKPWIPILLSWFTMIVETTYCVVMWLPRYRVIWLVCIIFLHAGIAILLGLWLFSLIMILLSISAFGYDCFFDLPSWKKRKILGEN